MEQFKEIKLCGIKSYQMRDTACTIYCLKNGRENYVKEKMILYCRKFTLNGLSGVLLIDVFSNYHNYGILHFMLF